ncbi:bidirectional sugar transporter SWEET2a-like [Impatiens glandulifera]|uniref:bidirectional sugar transporter SWEET2a-like n=1 Tax=Impatiens glandulifera TaxID=253017 RepID=UPI001FB1763D|nr:bidirectional sugar transporter SWEET2a-like [Impatiens glandulifera]
MDEASMGSSAAIPAAALFSSNSFLSDATGVAGNVLAFVLFVSPIPTFRRIMRNKSTEQFSGLPYIYSLMNCLICLWYGMPIVTPGIILVATVNTVGAVFQLTYTTIFIIFADRSKRVKMLGLLFAVFSVFLIIIVLSLKVFDPLGRQLFVGYLSVASLVSMFASPLSVINIVIKTSSVEFMPFYLSLSTFLMSVSFFAYGMLKYDAFIYVPNGIGAVLGVIQLGLYYYYYSKRARPDQNASSQSFLQTYVSD